MTGSRWTSMWGGRVGGVYVWFCLRLFRAIENRALVEILTEGKTLTGYLSLYRASESR